ncbi:MAG: PAS domain-containing sensor histidine kinase [Candidatus Liberibacter europaeus]|uniref:histidine kinase n=1 Tax=Candidatus Liberibacter europaeus TaxID=744859 RepID=A0A2T4VYC6_9HYPH|nr:PAS domain-containing sensor histidine kinase [Candidatus Liberibacter europaeus]PTL86782.1 MAG: PAS domain-containing sensor histidine kinase [Candidatus Liberibacter europaeus]
MENVHNISANCELYYSKSRQKITLWLIQILLRMKELAQLVMSPSSLSFNHTISIISIVFIIFTAMFITIKVTTNYSRQEKTTIQTTLLLVKSIETIFEKNNVKFESSFRKESESILKKLIANEQFSAEDFILLTKPDGIVFASSVENSPYIGKKISEIMPENLYINDISDTIQISEYSFEQKPYYFSVIRPKNNNGLIVVANSQFPLLKLWREDVTSGVTLFSSVSSIILFILFSHYRQAKRAKDIDDILLEANICTETALSHGKCGIWNFNFINKKFHLSQSMYEILGIPYSNKALSFSAIIRLVHSEDKEIYDIARLVSKGESTQLDKIFRMLHYNGTYIWIRARAQVINTTSKGINIIGIAMDITEQYYLEKRYAEADQRLAEAIECTSEAFVLWDKHERLVMCNIHYQKAYGLPDHVLLPGTKRAIIKEAKTHPIIECYTSGPERSNAITKEIKLADSRWLQINEWKTQDGGTVSVETDITQLKRNQKKLRESERRLMATINDLSTSRQILERQKTELSIANSKYQAEKERAEMANKAKSEFLAKMSHELRTPLNAILGFSEIIKREIFGELGSVKYYEYAKDIHDSGKHLLNLIDDILEMSKIESEHIRIDKKNVDLTLIIEDCVRLISDNCKNRNINFEAKISRELMCTADESIIKQVLFHIISNSIKFTNYGGRIIVRASRIEKFIIITIADTGIGIPKSAIEKIGKPFEQLQDQYAYNKGGSGLGLAISDSLINLHGGKLKILSIEGKGTIVLISIPI